MNYKQRKNNMEKDIISYFNSDIDQALIKELKLTHRGMAQLICYAPVVKEKALKKLGQHKELKGKRAFVYFISACDDISRSMSLYPKYKDMYGFLELNKINKNDPLVVESNSAKNRGISYSRQKECDERWLKKYWDKKIAEHRADPRPLRKQQNPKGIKVLASWGIFFDWDAPHPSGDGSMGRMYFAEPDPDYQVPEGECESLEEYYKRIEDEERARIKNTKKA